jgi:ribA/ribD-fused uncharacterized protein
MGGIEMPEHNVIDSKEALLLAIHSGFRPEYLFFWKPEPRTAGRMGNECLSQWYPASFTVEGILYPTAEHFMMAEKARFFGDEETLAKILRAPNPAIAKALGRVEVRGFTSPVLSSGSEKIAFCFIHPFKSQGIHTRRALFRLFL